MMTPARKFAVQDVRHRFAAEVAQADAMIDLAHAALLVAEEEEPRGGVVRYLAMLEEIGREARRRIERVDAEPLGAFNRFIFDELGFIGNEQSYYDPRNSLLSYVLERRTGIPITLSVVYMEVGRRAGLRVEGVGLPGHFVVRASASSSETAVLVDPFHGRVIDEDDCQERLDTVYGGQVPLTGEHLAAATTREILVRMLRNLKAIYAGAKLYRQALAVVERILLVAPEAIDEHRDRGLLLGQLGRSSEAIIDLQLYLGFAHKATDAAHVREQLKRVQTQLAMLN